LSNNNDAGKDLARSGGSCGGDAKMTRFEYDAFCLAIDDDGNDEA